MFRPVAALTCLQRLVVCLVAAALPACESPGQQQDATERAPEVRAETAVTGRMLVLPGVYNTRFQLRGFVTRAQAQRPGFDIEVRRWGIPLLALVNLSAHERNKATATKIAAEITAWRRLNDQTPFYLVGYSGGGGMAALIAAELPDDVTIDRLILIAPAISPAFPLEREVLPNVTEFAVNFASERDLQVGWGTRSFGTIDRQRVHSAGAVGFDLDHPRFIEWRWSERDRELGHRGHHTAYLNRRWQDTVLLPSINPDIDAATLAAIWASRHEEL